MDTEKSSHVSQQFQQQQQESALGTERLTSLHAKLHQEADKIRKWKVQTEMDMKHKEKKLSEANTTIESLRKSILELQLQNENLSTKLQDELSNREEVLQRVENTRNLISVLKDQEEKLENKLSSCETERTELKYLEKEHAQQFEEMTTKFRKLQLEAKTDHENLIKQVQHEQEQKEQLENMLQQKITETSQKIKSLNNKIDEKDIALREVHVMLQKCEEKLHATDKDLGASQQKVCIITTELTSAQQQLEKFQTECALLQGEKEQLATELVEERERAELAKQQENSVQEALDNSVAIFNKRQDDMQNEIDLLKTALADEQKRLKETRAQLTESMTFSESLKSSRDVLLLEKTEMDLCLEKLKTELTELQSEKYKNKAEISSLEAEVESLQLHLQQEQQTAAKLQVQVDEMTQRCAAMDREKKHVQHELNSLKQTVEKHKIDLEKTQQAHSEGGKHMQQLQDTVSLLQTQLSDKGAEVDKLQAELSKGQAQLSAEHSETTLTAQQLDKTTADLQGLTKEHQKAQNYISELEERLKVYSEEKDAMKNKLSDLTHENQLIQQERNKSDKAAETERQNQTEKQGQLEQKLKDLSADLKAKNKSIKDLEKELKSLRSKLTSMEKKQEERSRELDYLQQELSTQEQAKEHSDRIITSLQTHLEEETDKAKEYLQQMEKLKEETAKANKEKAEALMQCERQIIDMSVTLEKYTSDHQKLLAQKDKEMEELRSKHAQLSAMNQQTDTNASEARQESQRLQEEIATLKAQMEKLERDNVAEVDGLQTQLMEQAKLMEDMRQAASTVQAIMPVDHNMDEGRLPTTPVAQIQGQSAMNQQRSILRQAGSSSKRRKVAFISPSIDFSERSNTDSESSIDLEIEDHVMTQTKPGPRTPLRLRQSPHRTRPVISTPVLLTPSRHGRLDTAVTRPKHNTRHSTPDTTQIKEKEFNKTPNMRKAPMRTSKFFRTSPKERKILKKKEDAKERMAWFDDDNVYGFGFDD